MGGPANHERGAGVAHHVLEPLARQRRVERDERSARLQYAEHPDDRLHRSLRRQSHHRLGPHTQPAQPPRELRHATAQLRVAEGRLPTPHRRRLRTPRRLLLEQLRHAPLRLPLHPRRPAPLLQHTPPLLLCHQRQLREQRDAHGDERRVQEDERHEGPVAEDGAVAARVLVWLVPDEPGDAGQQDHGEDEEGHGFGHGVTSMPANFRD